MSRANTDLQQIQAFVVMIPLTISNGVTVLAVTVILFLIDPVLTRAGPRAASRSSTCWPSGSRAGCTPP